jgi:hypothetical protein
MTRTLDKIGPHRRKRGQQHNLDGDAVTGLSETLLDRRAHCSENFAAKLSIDSSGCSRKIRFFRLDRRGFWGLGFGHIVPSALETADGLRRRVLLVSAVSLACSTLPHPHRPNARRGQRVPRSAAHRPTGARMRRRTSCRDAMAPPRRRIPNRRGWGGRGDAFRIGEAGAAASI